MMMEECHSVQTRESHAQNSRSRGRSRGRLTDGSLQYSELLAQGGILDSEPCAGNKRSTDDDQERVHHPHFVSPLDRREVILTEPAPVWVLS